MEHSIELADPSSPDALRLLHAHLDLMREVSPPGTVHALDVEALRAPELSFWLLRQGDDAVACGALKELDLQHGELKSMHTLLSHRGQGIAARLLDFLLGEARGRGYRRLSLETGSSPAFSPARRLYERHGFQICGPFAQYTDHPHSAFLTLEL